MGTLFRRVTLIPVLKAVYELLDFYYFLFQFIFFLLIIRVRTFPTGNVRRSNNIGLPIQGRFPEWAFLP